MLAQSPQLPQNEPLTRYTVVVNAGYYRENSRYHYVRVEANSPVAAAHLAVRHPNVTQYDYVAADAVFAGWLEDLLPTDYLDPQREA